MTDKIQIILKQSEGEKKNKKMEDIAKKSLKIEKLKADNEKLLGKIIYLKNLFNDVAKDKVTTFLAIKEQHIEFLIDNTSEDLFSEDEVEIIIEIIQNDLNFIENFGGVSDKLREKTTVFFQQLLINQEQENEDLNRIAFEMMMEQMGLDVDPDDFDCNDFNSPEFKQKIYEKIKEKAAFETQQAAQEKVEKTDIDFQKLYKKLAKIVHPDLCKSDEDKLAKESLMKNLTTAWENRDYYEILSLWIMIDPENTVGLTLNEKNQKNIIKQLNEKINLLEVENWKIKNNYEDTSFYYQNFYAIKEQTILNKIKKFNIELEEKTEITQQLLKKYKLKNGFTKAIKAKLKEKKRQMQLYDLDFDELLSFFNSSEH